MRYVEHFLNPDGTQVATLSFIQGGPQPTIFMPGATTFSTTLIVPEPSPVLCGTTSNCAGLGIFPANYLYYRSFETRPVVRVVTDPAYAGQHFTLSVTPSNAAVPEPGAWALMIIGFGAVGLALWRRHVDLGLGREPLRRQP
jgi:hypothetical protein